MDDLSKEQVYLQWLFDKNQKIQQLQMQVQQLMTEKAELQSKLKQTEEGN